MSMFTALRQHRSQGKAPFTGLVMAGALLAGSANAQWVVTDPTHTMQTWIGHMMTRMEGYMQRYQDQAEYLQQAQRWVQSYQHMQQQLIQVQGFMAASMPMTDQFESHTDDYGMQDRCPGTTGSLNLQSLWQSFSPDVNGEVTEQQLQICQKIVLSENAKYNETVKLLRKMRDRTNEFAEIQGRRSQVGTSQGLLEANESDVSRFTTQTQMDLDYWQAMMTAYDSYIGLLNQDQQRLANAALNGKRTVWGTVVQGAALEGALRTLKQRDR